MSKSTPFTENLNAVAVLIQHATQATDEKNYPQAEQNFAAAQHALTKQLVHTLMLRADALLKSTDATDSLNSAIALLQQAAQLMPLEATPHRIMALAYRNAKQYAKALEAIQQAVARQPQNKDILFSLAEAYYSTHNYQRAIEEAQRTLALYPQFINLRHLQASAHKRLGEHDAALAIYDAILEQDPNHVDTLIFAGNVCKYHMSQFEMANHYFERALAITPNNMTLGASYVESLSNSRGPNEADYFDKAYTHAKKMLAQGGILPEHTGFMQGVFLRAADYDALNALGDANALMLHWIQTRQPGRLHHRMSQVQTLQDRLDLLKYHKMWGDSIEAVAQQHPISRRKAVKHDKIRVGFMSSDLRRHPVNYFTHPLLEGYDRTQFEFHCYSFYTPEADDVQKYIARQVDAFNIIAGRSDQQVAQRIANDGIDILFELGGTTHMNRAEVMAFKPAPIQVSWLGYPHSLGLSSIDYLLTDPYLCPPNPQLMLEKPFMLPQSWVTLGKLGFYEQEKIRTDLPQHSNGYITFGTMNNPYKYTHAWFAAVAQIMQQVGASRFLFVRPEGGAPSFQRNICAHFAKHGIDAERIEFLSVRGTHLRHYNRIDIALDTFPHTGGTTTCETLWMGVPVVTLAGDAFFERISHSNLHNAGLPQLSTASVAQYVHTAVALAHNTAQLLDWRRDLRQQLRQQPLGQNQLFVQQFQQVIKQTMAQKAATQAA